MSDGRKTPLELHRELFQRRVQEENEKASDRRRKEGWTDD
jgi:hypothetical protein